tara:strand:+ start:876 stop:1145 length:270 start_codon:yes stop_codon:yes gene_type:complete
MTTLEISLSKEDRESILFIKQELAELKGKLQTQEPSKYYSRKDLSKLFQVDLSTIHNWSKKGIIFPYQIGGRIVFKSEDIEKALVKLKN